MTIAHDRNYDAMVDDKSQRCSGKRSPLDPHHEITRKQRSFFQRSDLSSCLPLPTLCVHCLTPKNHRFATETAPYHQLSTEISSYLRLFASFYSTWHLVFTANRIEMLLLI